MFFYIFDDSGEIECGAYEPTKNFRKLVSDLRPGDIIKLFGGIGEQNTFNIEKFQVVKLNDVEYKNPICECGKRMTSAGKIRDLNVKNAEIKLMIIKKFLLKFSEN